jgi:hypothetical protein
MLFSSHICVILIRPDTATKLNDRLHQFPSIAKYMDMIWFRPLEHDILVNIATTTLKEVTLFYSKQHICNISCCDACNHVYSVL